MPSGHPDGVPPAGRDWAVIVPKWSLIVFLPATIFAAASWANGFGPPWIPALTVILGVAASTCVFALYMAAMHGGWARIRGPAAKPSKPKESYEQRAEALARGPAWKRFGLLASSLAALGGAAWVATTKDFRGHIAVKLAIFGVSGLCLSIWAFFKVGRPVARRPKRSDDPTDRP